ncbi:MAG: ATP-binding protein [Halanaeroarchaeum sp.]
MSMEDAEQLVINDEGITLPAIEVLTGRGVIFGKSGSGKSNSASVIIEELLERGFPLLIVDIEGEYYTLKERYEVVHVGSTDKSDMPIRETDPEQIVDICLDRNRPVIIDLSEVMDMAPAERFVDDVVTILFSREKEARKPFLLIVEEIHEFLPQQGGLDDLGETLIRVAKRGRKRGLGLTGMSQRPAAVDKDFITQCDWLVWHRLTWKNDTQVVKSILGSEKAKEVQELATGEAIMMTDWDEMVRRVQFRRKRTYDAADTPSLAPENRPDLTTDDATPDPRAQTEVQVDPDPDASADDDPRDAADSDDAAAGAESTDRGSPGEGTTTTVDSQRSENADEGTATGSGHASGGAQREGSEGQNGPGDLQLKSFEPPTASSGTRGRVTRQGSGRSGRSGDVTDVPKKHADPPFEDGDSRTVLWELGHMVSYVIGAAVTVLTRSSRYVVGVAAGKDVSDVDPLSPAAGADGDPTLSRDQIVLLISGLLLVVILVLAFVFS